jgi:lipopolysaccharide export system protein LptA
MATIKRSGVKGLAAGLAAGLLAALPAHAQLAQNSDAPVDITADELEVNNAECTAVWRGSAEALQDTARLRANVLRIYYKKGAASSGAKTNSCVEVSRMEGEGAVYYVTPQQKIRGDLAVYDAASETIVFTGDVIVAQDKNVMRGGRMVYSVATGQGQIESTAKGKGGARPRGVFYPSQKNQAPR